ncbi:hypothetical protein ATN84_22565 [Paramesorhizobium deserti]|uniref:Uncharacterized protein n=1 Tax=Paramesorhizobium deserti TaxID=1494590 RepID=A0A135HNA0_9HYPH|nr:hypothetical protein [Paramesorhizobium deserti]KXF74681.1 hypothetical protein ATN84_22565 [Paramesorhizobium deserti]
MIGDLHILRQHVLLAGRLFLNYGAVLAATWMAGTLLATLLMMLAVEIGFTNRLAGLIALVPVILLQLVLFVAMFVILRDGLPVLRFRARRHRDAPVPEEGAAETHMGIGMLAAALLAVLIPFYGYYAGWGLLGNTLRDYSKTFLATSMERIEFSDTPTERAPTALEVDSTLWVVAAVLLIWAIRRGAKAMHKRNEAGIWPLLVVACEASWAVLGLYVISSWQTSFVEWLAQLPSPGELWRNLLPPASAEVVNAATRPADWPPVFQPGPWLTALFWYALLPLIWFNLGAIVYGHDLNLMSEETQRSAGRVLERWRALPKPLRDFIGHFWVGLVKRWHAVANGVLLAGSAGFALTVSVLVLWRLADWAGRWVWVGLAELIGPRDLPVWQVVQYPLNLLFGAPGQPQDGVVVCVMQFCILAAGLELAGRAQAATAAPAPRA